MYARVVVIVIVVIVITIKSNIKRREKNRRAVLRKREKEKSILSVIALESYEGKSSYRDEEGEEEKRKPQRKA